MVNFLNAHGFKTTTASTVADALDYYAKDGPPVLLTTCMFGIQKRGVEIGTSIRNRDSRIAMIAYSGFVAKDLPETVRLAGFDSFLEMPFPLHVMHDTICDVLGKRGHADVAAYATHCFSVFELTHPSAADK